MLENLAHSAEFLTAAKPGFFESFITPAGIFGIIATIAVFASMQFKNIKTVLIIQLICNVSGMLSYFYDPESGGTAGSIIFLVAVAQSAVFLFYRLFNKTEPSSLMWIFATLFVVSSAITFKNWYDIFAMLGALTCAIALAQKNPTVYRLVYVVNGALWLTYDIVGAQYGMIFAHIITVISAILGVLRLDFKLFDRIKNNNSKKEIDTDGEENE